MEGTGAELRPELAAKLARSAVIRGQEGVLEHRGVCYDPRDPAAFGSAAEVDAYFAEAHGR